MKQLQIEGYRGFKHFAVDELARVNLFVGKNNSGKTSLLEAVGLLVSGGIPASFAQIAFERGEVVVVEEVEERFRSDVFPQISHFFFGHDVAPNSKFKISDGTPFGELVVSVVSEAPEDFQLTSGSQPKRPDYLERRFGIQPAYYLLCETMSRRSASTNYIPLTEEGAFYLDRISLNRKGSVFSVPSKTVPIRKVSLESESPLALGAMWDEIVTEGREEQVIEALQILEPRLSSVHFLTGDRVYRGGRGGILLGFRGEKRRVPLGSYGEGMRRLLVLSMSLTTAKNGVLLVDEIDTGLHWSVMSDMWKLISNSARRFNTQVFATTHSLDCLNGLSKFFEANESEVENVKVHKIDPRISHSVAMSVSEVSTALDHDVEIR